MVHLNGYEIMYFGVNLILMLDYRLSFDIEVKNSDKEIEVLMIKRKDDTKWKNNKGIHQNVQSKVKIQSKRIRYFISSLLPSLFVLCIHYHSILYLTMTQTFLQIFCL